MIVLMIAVGRIMAREVPWATCCSCSRRKNMAGMRIVPPPIPMNPLINPVHYADKSPRMQMC